LLNAKQEKTLSRWFPARGPCGFCGHADARHRLWDAIISRYRAGETVKIIAEDYDLTEAAINKVLLFRPYQEVPDAQE